MDANPPVINTTFVNFDPTNGVEQSYPDNYPANYPALNDASQVGLPNICWTGVNSVSSLYKMDSPSTPHTGTTASINFSANGLQSLCNESWGLDSVRIYADGALACCSTEFINVNFTIPVANLGPDIIT